MSVCLHDEACPGYGESHEAAMAKVYSPPEKRDLSGLRKIPLPGRIELPEVDQCLSVQTKMSLLPLVHVKAMQGHWYAGTSRVNRKQRRLKRREFRRARAVHRG